MKIPNYLKIILSYLKNWKLCTLFFCVIFVSQYSTNELFAENRVSEMKSSSRPYNFSKSTGNMDFCSTVHVVIACTGFRGPRHLSTLVKSLIFHRTRPVHLHLIVDGNSKLILNHLFHTWSIPHLNVTFYSIYEALAKIRHIHNSTSYSWWKLSVPLFLPPSVNKVMALEHNLVVDHDVAELWSYFYLMSPTEAIAAVEEQSDKFANHLSKETNGFNSDVMLLDLTKLRTAEWEKKWKNAHKKLINAHGSLRVDNVLNKVADDEPTVVHTLPCEWNVQLTNAFAGFCYHNVHRIKIINFNPISKEKSTRVVVPHFRYVEAGFQSLDGNMIRKPTLHCSYPVENVSVTLPRNDSCHDYQEAAKIQYRTHLYYLDYYYVSNKANDVTWVAHLSPDRLNMVELLCKHWKGPISLAFYLSDKEANKLVSFVHSSRTLRSRKNVGYHIVFKQGDVYPINFLRNVALEHVRTPYVFLSDMDFVPMPGLYNVMEKHIGSLLTKISEKRALVVPAFETQQRTATLPLTKAQAVRQLRRRSLHYFMQYTRPRSQSPTNFEQWKVTNKPYEVKWTRDFEPYIVVHRNVVRYDPRFVGYHYNRAAHTLELFAQGYRFHVLPNAYIVHLVHAKSAAASQYRTSKLTKTCLEIVKSDFILEMKKRYPNSTIDV